MPTKNTVVGLDIGRYAVKAVWARRAGGTIRIERTAKLRIPQGSSDIQNLLAPWLAQHAIAKQACVLGVPGRHCMFQPFVLPPNDPRRNEQVADMEVLRFNEMASEQMVYGFSATETNPGERLLLLTMSRPAILADLLASAKAMSLDAADLIPDPVAVFHAVGTVAADKAPTLFVHIGHASSDIAIGSANGLLFARSFAAGGHTFTETLADTLDVSVAKAEDMKLTQGSLAPETPYAAPLAAAANAWLEELQACLSVYDSILPGKHARPVALALSGGGALLPGLAEYAAGKLGLELVPLPAWPASAELRDAGAFAVAFGLANAALNPSGPTVSLLPTEVRDNQIFRSQKPYWIAGGLAAGLILAIGLIGGLRDTGKKKAYYESQEASLRVREGIAAQIDAVRAEQERLHTMTEPVVKLLRAGPQMRNLITLAANSMAPDDQIVMVCDADSFFAVAPQAKPAPPARRGLRDLRRRPAAKEEPPDAPTFERVIVEGYTRTANLSTVRTLIARLREAEFVESADLLGDDVLNAGHTAQVVQKHSAAKQFVIEVKLTPL